MPCPFYAHGHLPFTPTPRFGVAADYMRIAQDMLEYCPAMGQQHKASMAAELRRVTEAVQGV